MSDRDVTQIRGGVVIMITFWHMYQWAFWRGPLCQICGMQIKLLKRNGSGWTNDADWDFWMASYFSLWFIVCLARHTSSVIQTGLSTCVWGRLVPRVCCLTLSSPPPLIQWDTPRRPLWSLQFIVVSTQFITRYRQPVCRVGWGAVIRRDDLT